MCLGKKKTKSPSRISHISAGCCTSLLPPEACSSLCYARGVADAARAAAPCPSLGASCPHTLGEQGPQHTSAPNFLLKLSWKDSTGQSTLLNFDPGSIFPEIHYTIIFFFSPSLLGQFTMQIYSLHRALIEDGESLANTEGFDPK